MSARLIIHVSSVFWEEHQTLSDDSEHPIFFVAFFPTDGIVPSTILAVITCDWMIIPPKLDIQNCVLLPGRGERGRERSKLTTSGVRTLNTYWTVGSRRTVLAIKIVRKSLKKNPGNTPRNTNEAERRLKVFLSEIQGKTKQAIARTLARGERTLER